MSQSVYRIKGLEFSQAPKGTEIGTPMRITTDKTESSSSDMFGQIGRALGVPRLTDALYHFDDVDRLAALWPTFSYLHPRGGFGPIKSVPLCLTQCLFPPRADQPDPLVDAILDVSRQQGREQVAIRTLMADASDHGTLDDSPLAMSLTGYLKRGSPWLTKHRDKIFQVILRSPEASFIALASGAWNDQSTLLVGKIASSPELALQLWRHPVLKHKVTEDWIRRVLHDHPVHLAVAFSFEKRLVPEARQLLSAASATDPQAAGICFGLDPHNPKANIWWKLARTDGHALYWIGRIWKSAGHKILDLPGYYEIADRLQNEANAKWGYHWARDLDPMAVKRFASQLWPSPWAVELIEDLKLSQDLVGDLVQISAFDEHNFWDSCLILWAAEYCAQ